MQDEIIKLIEEFETRLQALKEEYNKNEIECEFERGDTCWTVSNSGTLIRFTWHGDKHDVARYSMGNVFKTREEALLEVEKRKVLHELRQLGRPFRPNQANYSICLRHDSRDNQKRLFYKAMIEVDHVYGDYYFDSIPKAKDAVYRIGEERIMKYLFRVED